jgi:superfamily II DNA or RNA helicase
MFLCVSCTTGQNAKYIWFEKDEYKIFVIAVVAVIIAFCIILWKTLINLNSANKKLTESKKAVEEKDTMLYDILRNVAFIEFGMTDTEKDKERKFLSKIYSATYGEASWNWTNLYAIMNRRRNNFYENIRRQHPDMREEEFRIFCLSCENLFSDNEIAFFTGKSLNMVRRIRSDLRKKLGMIKNANFEAQFK